MSKFLRQSIVPIAAVIGSQLPGLLVQSQPGQSSASCAQWVNNAIDGASYNLQRTFNPPEVPEGFTEGEYNQLREVYKTDDIRLSTATTAPPVAAAAPSNVGSQATTVASGIGPVSADDRAIDEQIARDRGLTLDQYYRSIGNGGY